MNRMSVIIGFLLATFIMSGCITHSTDKSCDDFTYIDTFTRSLVLEKVECNGNIVDTVAELNKMISDTKWPKEYRHGIKIICEAPEVERNPSQIRVNLNMTNVSLHEVLQEIVNQTGLNVLFIRRRVVLY